MKRRHIFLGLAVLAAVLFWLLEAVWDYYYHGASLRLVMRDVPHYVVFAAFVVFVIVIGVALEKKSRAEQAARQSEERFRTATEKALVGVYIIQEGKFRYVNPALAEMFGYKLEEIIDRLGPLELTHPDDHEKVTSRIKSRLNGRAKSAHYTFRGVKKDGAIIHCEVLGTRGEFRDKPAIIGTILDITEREQAEALLRNSEEHYRTVFENTGTATVIVEEDTTILLANSGFERLSGYSREEIEGKMKWTDFVVPEDLERMRRYHYERRKEGGKAPTRYEFRFVSRDGSIKDIFLNVNVIPGTSRSVASLQDITEQKRTEEALQESEERYRTLIETMAEGFGIQDEDLNITYANEKFCRMLGYQREELIGRSAFDFLDDENQTIMEEQSEKRKQGEAGAYELVWTAKDGRKVPTLISPAPLFDDTGKFTGSFAVIRDLTEQQQVEWELAVYRKQLRSLSSELSLVEERERRQLAAELHDSVGHALTFLKMKLEGLRESEPATALAEALSEISSIVDQALDSTRSLTFDISPPILYALGLEPALEWLCERFQEQHGILCEFEDDKRDKPLDEDVQMFVFRAVRELLANIAKHARASKAKVSIKRDTDDLEITVEDDGAGFDTSVISAYGVTEVGFGLFNIRERLEHVGGYFGIRSQPGKGTAVTLVAPVRTD